MSQDLQGLLERINEDGFKKIESEREAKLAAAEAEAERIVAEARREAERIVTEAKAEEAKLRQVGADAVRQAARDVGLALEAELAARLQRLLQGAVTAAMTPELLGQILVEMVKGYAAKGHAVGGVEALLKPADAAKLGALVQGALAQELGRGVKLVAAPQTGAGIMVRLDGQSVVHDLSAESVAEMLSAYLNPKIVAILRDSDAS